MGSSNGNTYSATPIGIISFRFIKTKEALKIGFPSAFVTFEFIASFEGVFAFKANRKRVVLAAQRLRQNVRVEILVVNRVDVFLQRGFRVESRAARRALEARRRSGVFLYPASSHFRFRRWRRNDGRRTALRQR